VKGDNKLCVQNWGSFPALCLRRTALTLAPQKQNQHSIKDTYKNSITLL